MKRSAMLAVTIVFTALLFACGGGGGGSSSDTTPPSASPVGPAQDATGVEPNSAVSAAFTEAVTGVDGTTFLLKDAADSSVSGTAVLSGLTATFTPSVPLACSTAYTATLTDGIKDLAGNSLATTSWSFTTRDVASWAYVDGTTVNGLNKDPNQIATGSPSLTAFGSKLYAIWQERSGPAFQIRVALYNGNDTAPSWSFVDGNGATGINKDATKPATAPVLAVFGSKLYAAWSENGATGSQIRVAVYNGDDSAPSWSFVDGNGVNGLNKNAAQFANTPRLIVFGSKLYAAWAESNGLPNQIRVAVYNGNDASPSWAFVDRNGVNGINKDATKSANSPQLAVSSSKLYAAWWEPNGTANQVRVAVYNGNDGAPSWDFVDGNGVNGINKDAASSAGSPRLIMLGSRLYATWNEAGGAAFQVRVAVYNGDDSAPSWTFVDGNGATGINKDGTQSAGTPAAIVLGSKLYAAWSESNGTVGQIRVAVYNGDDAAPSWVFVDGNGVNGINKDTAQGASTPQMTIAGPKLYITWMEQNGAGNEVRVAVGQ